MEIRNYFDMYTSNTLGGSGNQFIFTSEKNEIKTGRIYYRIQNGGRYNYSFLFSNVVDSTYSNGSVCTANHVCPEWTLYRLRAGKCHAFPEGVLPERFTDGNKGDEIAVSEFKDVYFGGKLVKDVGRGETFCSDPVELEFEKYEFLCLEITFSGTEIPYHEEILLPLYIKNGDFWEYCKKMPVPSMVGCDRNVKARISFLGDSITQGIGTPLNSYRHWNALFAEKAGGDFSYWNLGIGFGRASDAASDGSWLFKAKNSDICFVCFGVNDLLQGRSKQSIMRDLGHIYQKLTDSGVRVVMQTVPPFDYPDGLRAPWAEINRFILSEPSFKEVFNVAPLLTESEEKPFNARFGGHPDEEGCKIWAERLYSEMKRKLPE